MVKNHFCLDVLSEVNNSIDALIDNISIRKPFDEDDIRYFCNQIEINITRLKLTAQLLTTPEGLEEDYIF